MKLIEVRTPTRSHTMPPAISFTKIGLIRLNPAAIDVLKLSSGDRISFYQDEREPKDWYIRKQDDGAYKIRKAGRQRAWIFNSATLAAKFQGDVGGDFPLSFPIAYEPAMEDYYAILTSVKK